MLRAFIIRNLIPSWYSHNWIALPSFSRPLFPVSNSLYTNFDPFFHIYSENLVKQALFYADYPASFRDVCVYVIFKIYLGNKSAQYFICLIPFQSFSFNSKSTPLQFFFLNFSSSKRDNLKSLKELIFSKVFSKQLYYKNKVFHKWFSRIFICLLFRNTYFKFCP